MKHLFARCAIQRIFMTLFSLACLAGPYSHGAWATVTFTVKHAFTPSPNGTDCQSPLVQAADGSYYGMATGGGAYGQGVVFKVTPAGVNTVLHDFHGGAADGAYPCGGLIIGTDGNLYGATSQGGAGNSAHNLGTIFKLTPGGAFSILHSFANGDDGGSPDAGVIQAADGNFYGTATTGGPSYGGHGVIYKLTPAGVFTTLNSFTGANGDSPRGALMQATNGNFYGTTFNGGQFDLGTVFRVTMGGTLTSLFSFQNDVFGASPSATGMHPSAGLIQGADGDLYGGTSQDNLYPGGTVFKITMTGVFSLLNSFVHVICNLLQASNSVIYGVNSGYFNHGTIFAGGPIASFNGANGSQPMASLIQAADGALYGTTYGGGIYNRGVIYKATTSGTLTDLYSFGGSDAARCVGGLTLGSDGNLYGASEAGGIYGVGAVFKMTPAGVAGIAHAFAPGTGDGTTPNGGLLLANDGLLYGTTSTGSLHGDGCVFSITPGGVVTILHAFNNTPSGTSLRSRLIQATDGNLYGVCDSDGANGDGSVYKMSADGTVTTVYSFNSAGGDGYAPLARLVQGTDGNFYGTTTAGGALSHGTVFKMTPAGVLTTLHSFADAPGDGSYARAGLTQGADGNFYGTAQNGGANGKGCVYKITPSGTLTVLHSFNTSDGAGVYGGLILATDGNFYGTTAAGGDNGSGTIYKMTADGTVTVLHSFTASDGQCLCDLVQAPDGTFYGTTVTGNGNDDAGMVFQLDAGLPTPIPDAPIGLTATAGPARVTLSWTASSGATSYNVKRATVTGGPYTTAGTPTSASFTNTGLADGTTYYFVVSAVNSGGESANSAQASATPINAIPFDFNGDGKPDIVLQNSSTSQIALWYMSGTTVLSTQNVSLIPAAGWRVAGVGDFNGDGKPDLVLRNAGNNKAAIWFLDNAAFVSGQYVSATIPSGWTIAGVGDFNQDGKPDLVLQNTTNNKVAFWYMNGATVTGGAYASVTAAGWRVSGTGDFNGDGKTDLVLQSTSNNKVAFWYMNGATVQSGQYASTAPPPGWSVAGVCDTNADGKPDLILQDGATNKVADWYLNGATITGGAYMSQTPPAAWHVAGPR